VREFEAQGWRVAAGYHVTPIATETRSIWPLKVDVTNPVEVDGIIARVQARWGPVHALVNNAGAVGDRLLPQMDEADWDHVMAVNVNGARLCSRAVLPAMIDRRDGHIVNVASYSARHGRRGQANYVAAKAALLGLTVSLAREVGCANVRVNAVLPGPMQTGMTAGLEPKVLEDLAKANVLGRMNSPAEAARFISFLATTQDISGQVFQLDSRVAAWA
jgi:3-oxoacyl-[acyl-carrier protein] reductase